IILCFFLYCFCVLRDLLSFPTRRSSDLQADDLVSETFVPFLLRLSPYLESFGYFSSQFAGKSKPFLASVVQMPLTHLNDHLNVRSEEHTSELQSRFDLVCRLLLEKKKHI